MTDAERRALIEAARLKVPALRRQVAEALAELRRIARS